MNVDLKLNGGPDTVEIDFDPRLADWKSQNYGQFTPDGIYFDRINRTLFVKRLIARPLSLPFLVSHMNSPCSVHLPCLHAVAEDPDLKSGFRYYLFYEQLDGVTLDILRGRINESHCHEILSGVFSAIRSIIKQGYWYNDLDVKNVFVGRGGSGSLVHLIDIDSCMPLTMSFQDYLSDSHRRPNVNERYWSYVVSRFKGERLDRLSGHSLSQAAFTYFAVDLFFFINYPETRVSLGPADIGKIMRKDNSRYFPQEAARVWRAIHGQILDYPEKGARWKDVDRFVTLAYGFPESLSRTVKPESLFDGIFRAMGGFFEGVFGR